MHVILFASCTIIFTTISVSGGAAEHWRKTSEPCGENEEFLEKGGGGEPTCDTREGTNSVSVCYSGCFCKDQFLRDHNNGRICVPLEKCTNQTVYGGDKLLTCGENEIKILNRPIAAKDVASCNDPTPSGTGESCRTACICKEGLITNSKGECVTPDKCEPASEICNQPQYPPEQQAFCWAYFPMFWFNSTSKKCEEFIYGGCGGTSNRFDTKELCEARCASEMPK